MCVCVFVCVCVCPVSIFLLGACGEREVTWARTGSGKGGFLPARRSCGFFAKGPGGQRPAHPVRPFLALICTLAMFCLSPDPWRDVLWMRRGKWNVFSVTSGSARWTIWPMRCRESHGSKNGTSYGSKTRCVWNSSGFEWHVHVREKIPSILFWSLKYCISASNVYSLSGQFIEKF